MNIRLALIALLAAPPLAAQQPHWVATWAASYFAAPPLSAKTPAEYRQLAFANSTLRQVVHTSIGGARVRVRFTNEYGLRPLAIGAAHIAVRDSAADIRAGTDHAITFDGNRTIVIRPGGEVVSDPIDMAVPQLGDLAISVYLPDTTEGSTVHIIAAQSNYVGTGDRTSSVHFAADTTITQWLFLAGVDVENSRARGAIVAFGNSITDGHHSTTDANARWPNVLARRVLASGAPLAVVDAGISGNRVLSTGTGPSALARFDRDVLMQPGVTHVIILEGINDISRGVNPPSPRDQLGAADVIYGLHQLADRAHERGLVVIGCTLTPSAGRPGSVLSSSLAQAREDSVNHWIRTSGVFDGVVDFNAATRDPAQPDRFLAAYDSGDHLHPNDAGYAAMGNAIDLVLFQPRRHTSRR